MFSEVHLNGILFAPIVLYTMIGTALFVPIRYVLGATGVLKWIWHPALFELSLFICVVAAVVLACA